VNRLLGLIGLSLATLGAGTYFHLPVAMTLMTGIIKGLCAGLFVFGGGLFIDSLKK